MKTKISMLKVTVFQVTVVLFSVLVGVSIWAISYNVPRWKTEQSLPHMALDAKASRCTQEDFMAIQNGNAPLQDGWGRDVGFKKIVEQELIAYVFCSSGRDGEFGTEDDIEASKLDWNKSRIIGKWLGKKSKETFIGLKEGFNAPSEFKKGTGQ